MRFDLTKLAEEILADEILAYGTTEGAVKGWDTRGRGRKVQPEGVELKPKSEEEAKNAILQEAVRQSKAEVMAPYREALERLEKRGQYVGSSELEKAVQVFEEAKRQVFPPDKVNIDYTNRQFKVGERVFSEGGHYDPKTGEITIRASAVSSLPLQGRDTNLQGLMAHEIAHYYDQLAMDAYKEEQTRLMADKRDVMRPNGAIRDQYKAEYPLSVRFANAVGEPEMTWGGLAKDDGVSDYSKAWWDAWNHQQAYTDQAVGETVAEIARKQSQGDFSGVSSRWLQYYRAVMGTAREQMWKGK